MKLIIWLIIFGLFGGAYALRKSNLAPILVMIAVVLAIVVIALGKYLTFI